MNKKEAKENLISNYSFSEEQAEAIVMLQLYRLTNTDIFALKQEQQDSMVGYGDVLATTLVINSSLNANLTLLAVIGEKQDGGFKRISQVSKEYNLNVLKHINQ